VFREIRERRYLGFDGGPCSPLALAIVGGKQSGRERGSIYKVYRLSGLDLSAPRLQYYRIWSTSISYQ